MGTVRRSALAAAHPAGGGRKLDECGGAGVDLTAPACIAFARNTRGMSWDTRWMSGSMRCTWASIGCGRGASVAGPGWIRRVSGVDVRGRVQSLTRRSITSQAMTAGELPLSKARPRSGAAKTPAPAGHGWLRRRHGGRRSSVAKNGPDRAARAQTSTCFRDPGVRSCRRSSDRVIPFARGGQLDGWAGVMPLERTTGQPTMSQHRRRLDR